MRPTTIRFDEILFHLVPTQAAAASASQREPISRDVSCYDALIYSTLPVDLWITGRALPPGRPREIAGLPFRGVEQISVRWRRYEELLDLYHEAEKNPPIMVRSLLDTMSPGLERLFGGELRSEGRPVRVWWASETSDVEVLPWELLVYGSRRAGKLSFVRGLPPVQILPRVPLRGPIQIALIGGESPVEAALGSLDPSDYRIERIPGPPRDALLQACHRGFEIVHMIADGWVSLGLDGVLMLGEHTMPPAELSALLRGSRVAIVALTPPQSPQRVRETPTVYRAFTHLGRSAEGTASIIAPIGPLPPWEIGPFWGRFYSSLARTLSVEDALIRSRREGLMLPVALFLRHRLGQELARREIVHEVYESVPVQAAPAMTAQREAMPAAAAPARAAPSPIEPTQVSAALEASRDFIEQLRRIDEQFKGVGDDLMSRQVVQQELTRQERLEEKLDSYRSIDDIAPEAGDE